MHSGDLPWHQSLLDVLQYLLFFSLPFSSFFLFHLREGSIGRSENRALGGVEHWEGRALILRRVKDCSSFSLR